MSESKIAIDFDLIVSDFILPTVDDEDVFNTHAINGRTRWFLLTDLSEVRRFITAGKPVINNTYGVYIGLEEHDAIFNTCIADIQTTNNSVQEAGTPRNTPAANVDFFRSYQHA